MSRKVKYLLAVVIYAVAGIIGILGNAYTEVTSSRALLNNYLFILIICSLLVGGVYFYFFTKAFPKGYFNQNTFAKIFLPLVFMILSFAMNRGVLLAINSSFGKRTAFYINGYVASKYVDGSKRNNYNLELKDTLTGQTFKFYVKKNAYIQAGEKGARVQKEFMIGSLGIIYRSGP